MFTDNKYQSDDLDFISPATRMELDRIMQPLGFERQGRYFVHPNTNFYVEFPGRVVNVAHRLVTETMEIKAREGTFRVLPPTYCIMDRLAQYIAWGNGARDALDQAVWVAQRHRVRYSLIKEWAEEQNAGEAYIAFRRQLNRARRKARDEGTR